MEEAVMKKIKKSQIRTCVQILMLIAVIIAAFILTGVSGGVVLGSVGTTSIVGDFPFDEISNKN